MDTKITEKIINLNSLESINQYSIKNSENLTLFKIFGKDSTKAVLISTYLHGDEPCGYNAVQKILSNLKTPNHDIYILLGNSKAAQKNVRFINENFNRVWTKNPNTQNETKSYNLTQYLKTKNLLGVLDLHSFSDKESDPHFFHLNTSFAKHFFNNKIKFAFKVGANENMLIEQFKDIPSFLIECGYHYDKKSENLALECIDTFLKKLSTISENLSTQQIQTSNTIYLENETNVKFKPSFKLERNLNKKNLVELLTETKIGFLISTDDIIINGENTFKELFEVKQNILYLKKNHFITLITSNEEKMFESGCYIYDL